MAKKRPNEDSNATSSLSKKERLEVFDGTAFKNMLKDPTKAMKGENETFVYLNRL